MNHIENGIAGCAIRKYSTTETFIKGEWVQADLDGVQGLYESLTNSNLGNPLSDETKWKKVDLGGGSGTGGPGPGGGAVPIGWGTHRRKRPHLEL